ncbi:MAG TPA: hypothetical protein VIN40_09330 [Candidatus Tyrphobacter sp.]
MANRQQIWADYDAFENFGLYYSVHQDFEQQREIHAAFDIAISARIPGAQIGAVIVRPIKEGPWAMNISYAKGSIGGEVSHWHGVLPGGGPGPWENGGLFSARFDLTVRVDVEIDEIGSVNLPTIRKTVALPLYWNVDTQRYVYVTV